MFFFSVLVLSHCLQLWTKQLFSYIPWPTFVNCQCSNSRSDWPMDQVDRKQGVTLPWGPSSGEAWKHAKTVAGWKGWVYHSWSHAYVFFSTNQIQIWHESWGMRLVMKGSPHLFRFPLQLCSGNVMAVAGLVKCDQLLGPWFYQFPWLDPRPCVWTFKLSHCNRCCIAFVSAWSSENIKSYQIRSLHMALWIPP